MLNQYVSDTQGLLQNPAATTALYSTPSLTRFINISRGQLAGESRCIRAIGTINTVIGQRAYNFSSINVGVSASTGIDGVLHVRQISWVVGSGQRMLAPTPWEQFYLFNLNNPVPQSGFPRRWSQYAQGGAPQAGTTEGQGGSFYIDPIPDASYPLTCDCTCFPIGLVNDNTVEAIPYLWTDAVPFFAAYYAYLSSQTGARQADAARMFELYKEFSTRARNAANPSVNRWMYQEAADPVQAMKLGTQKMGA